MSVPPPDQQAFRICRELLSSLSDQWRLIDLNAMDRIQPALLLMGTATGLIECRLRCRAWTDSAAVEAEVVVVGLWLDLTGQSVLCDEFRKAVPAWEGKRVAVQVEPAIEARLTLEGLEAQANVNSPMDMTWLVMAYMVSKPRAARVKLRLTGPAAVPGVAQAAPAHDQTHTPAALADLAEAVRQIRDDVHGIRKAMASGHQPVAHGQAKAADHGDEHDSGEGDDDFGGPQPDPQDNRVALWMGKRIYLGHGTCVSRLFWLLAQPPGRARSWVEVQQAVDGMEISPSVGSSKDEIRKSQQRVRKAISNLRRQLVDSGLDDHVLITKGGTQEDPDYTMLSRF